uniref:F-box domain-containing protein n=1 Tax=Steinernema glaseri TaxID=37863 RepID=A0A1I8ABU6_9BILA
MPTREKVPTGKGNKVSSYRTFGSPHGPSLSQRPIHSPTMEFVPVMFLDALCSTLKKTDLRELRKIGRVWSRTAATHYRRRKEFRVYLHVNRERTEVGVELRQIGYLTSVPYASLSKYDRIRSILVRHPHSAALPVKMPMERFKTKVLPLLTSLADACELDISGRCLQNLTDSLFRGLRGSALKIKTGYLGGKSAEFIAQQIASGRLEHLQLYETEWPDSMKASLLAFLKSLNFVSLDIKRTNLTVDLDMLRCIAERFLEVDLRKGTRLLGKPSEEMKALHSALLSGDTLPWLGRFLEQHVTVRSESNRDLAGISWIRPGLERLYAWISSCEFVEVYRLYDCGQPFDV